VVDLTTARLLVITMKIMNINIYDICGRNWLKFAMLSQLIVATDAAIVVACLIFTV